MGALVRLNRDLFVRTILLTIAILLLTRAGAVQGPLVLAANGILYQMFILSALILDGFESAAQVLCGEALGARDRNRFMATVRSALLWGVVLGLVLTLGYAAGGRTLAAAFTTAPEVIAATAAYAPWLALLPLLGVSAYVLDGVFVGAGWTRAMMGTMLAAMAVYAVLLWGLHPWGHHGLWAAFTLFFVMRACAQAAVLPGLVRRSFGAPPPQ